MTDGGNVPKQDVLLEHVGAPFLCFTCCFPSWRYTEDFRAWAARPSLVREFLEREAAPGTWTLT